MLSEARAKAADRGIENVEFAEGRFREPKVDRERDADSATPTRAHPPDGRIDVVTSNFAMHHLSDEEKVEAIDVIAAPRTTAIRPRRRDVLRRTGPRRALLQP